MESLYSRATSVSVAECELPSGRIARLRQLEVHFGRATPDRLKPGAMQATYIAKPLVSFNGAGMFGELALVRWLEVDGWDGAWLDVSHGMKVWQEMPTAAFPTSLPVNVQRRVDDIIAANGGRLRGMFNVVAWRNNQIIFLEYRSADQRSFQAEGEWIDAALRAGVSEADLFIVIGDQ